MDSLKSKKMLIGGVVLVIILFGALYYFYSSNSSVPVDILIPQESQTLGQDIIVLVEKLNSISSIDSSLFSSVLFTRLRDFTAILNPESQGKLNPFAPIGQWDKCGVG